MRVAGGAVTRLITPEVKIVARVVEIGGEVNEAKWPAILAAPWDESDSLGAVVECVATGVPTGWGAPVHAKLDADLASACMRINAGKGVEIGEGFAAARMKESDTREGMVALVLAHHKLLHRGQYGEGLSGQ